MLTGGVKNKKCAYFGFGVETHITHRAEIMAINSSSQYFAYYIILFLTILLSFAGISHAEQTNTIKYLVNEPLTLLDLGLYRLNRLVNEDPYGRANVTFDWENNKITINITILEHFVNTRINMKNEKEAYAFASRMINSLRDKL
jgi:hypothetical protein